MAWPSPLPNRIECAFAQLAEKQRGAYARPRMKLPIIALAALLARSVAFAQDAAPEASPAPAKARTEERFKQLDTDKDNALIAEEFKLPV